MVFAIGRQFLFCQAAKSSRQACQKSRVQQCLAIPECLLYNRFPCDTLAFSSRLFRVSSWVAPRERLFRLVQAAWAVCRSRRAARTVHLLRHRAHHRPECPVLPQEQVAQVAQVVLVARAALEAQRARRVRGALGALRVRPGNSLRVSMSMEIWCVPALTCSRKMLSTVIAEFISAGAINAAHAPLRHQSGVAFRQVIAIPVSGQIIPVKMSSSGESRYNFWA